MTDFWSEFSFRGNPRLSLWWANPNYAAAVIATIMPLWWLLEKRIQKTGQRQYLQLTIWATECCFVVLLANTYSRGGILAMTSGLFVFNLLSIEQPLDGGYRLFTQLVRSSWLRFIVYATIFTATGASTRVGLIMQGDRSALNRLDVWKGAFAMVFARPLLGWGYQRSGINYTQWFQPTIRMEMHRDMINSFLEVAVSLGLPALGVVLYILITAFTICVLTRSRESGTGATAAAAGSAIYIFSCAGFVTNIFTYPSVVWTVMLPIAVAARIFVIRPSCVRRKALVLAASISAITCLAIYVVGAVLQLGEKESPVVAYRDGTLELSGRRVSPEAAGVVWIFPDYKVLGGAFGKQIREAAKGGLAYNLRLRVCPPGVDLIHPDSCRVIVIGARAAEFINDSGHQKSELFMFFPTTPPPNSGDPRIKQVFLPEHDEIGYKASWNQWATSTGCPITVVGGVGQVAGNSWIDIFKACIR